jgi:spermidine synthase
VTPVDLVAVPKTRIVLVGFTAATFLGGLLLFTLQPMIARIALPRLGGTPAVWNSAMLSYQVLLLGGYACAYLLSRLSAAQQVLIYIALFIVAAFWLPVGLLVGDPPTNSNPIFWEPWLIIASIGPPFFILAAQAPLLQNWYSLWSKREPYQLYVASSLGNFVGLLLYPFVLEPFLSIRDQRLIWSIGFGVFGLLIAVCAALGMRKSNTDQSVQIVAPQPKLNFKRLAQWTIIAAVPSGLILSTTLHLTTDIVAMPLIWIVPLGLYLLSFTLAFSIKIRLADFLTPYAPMLIAALAILAMASDQFEILVTGSASLTLLFVVSLTLHRKLYLDRPDASALTQFYLALALGGAIGGAFVTLIAPLLFDWTYEFPLLAIAAVWLVKPNKMMLLCVTAGMIGLVGIDPLTMSWNGLRQRSYFGIYTIRENETGTIRTLGHGNTLHGAQHLETDKLIDPTTYFGKHSGAGQILEAAESNARIGVMGMGVGTLACYAQPHQQWAFYEIDPLVVDIGTKQGWFTFMANCTPNAALHIGDARLTLAKQPSGSLDILVMDVFSSDTIPTHLLTREAFDIYDSVLAERGVMLMHISNRYLDLEPVIASEAQARGWAASLNRHDPTEAEFTAGETASVWVLIARSKDELTHMLSPKTQSEWRPLTLKPNMVRWTDDHSSILSLLKPIFN